MKEINILSVYGRVEAYLWLYPEELAEKTASRGFDRLLKSTPQELEHLIISDKMTDFLAYFKEASQSEILPAGTFTLLLSKIKDLLTLPEELNAYCEYLATLHYYDPMRTKEITLTDPILKNNFVAIYEHVVFEKLARIQGRKYERLFNIIYYFTSRDNYEENRSFFEVMKSNTLEEYQNVYDPSLLQKEIEDYLEAMPKEPKKKVEMLPFSEAPGARTLFASQRKEAIAARKNLDEMLKHSFDKEAIEALDRFKNQFPKYYAPYIDLIQRADPFIPEMVQTHVNIILFQQDMNEARTHILQKVYGAAEEKYRTRLSGSSYAVQLYAWWKGGLTQEKQYWSTLLKQEELEKCCKKLIEKLDLGLADFHDNAFGTHLLQALVNDKVFGTLLWPSCKPQDISLQTPAARAQVAQELNERFIFANLHLQEEDEDLNHINLGKTSFFPNT